MQQYRVDQKVGLRSELLLKMTSYAMAVQCFFFPRLRIHICNLDSLGNHPVTSTQDATRASYSVPSIPPERKLGCKLR